MPGRTQLDRFSDVGRTLALLLLGVAALLVAVSMAFAVEAGRDRVSGKQQAKVPTLGISGDGEVDVPASEAKLEVGLRGCAGGPSAALLQLNSALAPLAKRLRDAGLPERAIARGNVSTDRRYGRNIEDPWCSTVTSVVTVEDLDLLDEAVAAVAKSRKGITYLQGPTYEYGADGELEQQALADAVENARQKADDAAKRTGMRVAGVRSIEEGETGVERPDQPVPYYAGQRMDGEVLAAGGMALEDADSKQTAITRNAGEATAYASVAVTFELEPR